MTALNAKVSISDLGKVCVISPHLDDAVLSCGALLAQCSRPVILTVLAGDSPDPHASTDWDRLCGFRDSAEAMAARRSEDRDAARILSSDVVHLPFPDGQYQPDIPDETLAMAIFDTLRDVAIDTLLVPLGLFHRDHIRIAQAWMHPAFSEPMKDRYRQLLAYEDVPYRHIGTSLQDALTRLDAHGLRASPLRWASVQLMPTASHATAAKRQALDAYASQLNALPQEWIEDARAAEGYWQIDMKV